MLIKDSPGENWSCLRFTWDSMMETLPIEEVISWLKQAPGGSYCVEFNEDGMAVHFENPKDLKMFIWRWAY